MGPFWGPILEPILGPILGSILRPILETCPSNEREARKTVISQMLPL